jgi:hypothetical protein
VVSALFLWRDDAENNALLWGKQEYYFCHKAALRKEQIRF